jgi:CheY-like chemotaxis protein
MIKGKVAAKKNNLKILVIEDEEMAREAILLKLKRAKISSSFAEDGVDGLEKLQNEKFSGVLLDLRMPRGDGFFFMEEKNKNEKFRDIPVIVFSNFSQPEFINRALSLGARGYLIKAQNSVGDIVEQLKNCILLGRCPVDR